MFSPLLTKFYNTDAPDVPSAPVSMAEAMAKSGSRINPSDEGGQPPVNITEKKVEATTAPASTPAATATSTQIAEQAKQDPPKPAEQPKNDATQIAEPPKAGSWKEVLKSQQPDTVLKELGFDDRQVKLFNTASQDAKMLAFFEHWMNNGNTNDYLKELNTDYSKMPPEEVLRQQLRLEYPEASEKGLNALFKAEVLNAYKLDPDMYSPEEVEESRELMTAKADKFRKTLIERQQQFLIPKAPEPKAPEPDNRIQEQQKAVEAYKSLISENKLSKDILASKVLPIGEGDDRFNYPLPEPQEVIDMLWDGDKWGNAMKNASGEPDVDKQILVAAFASNPQKFLKDYAQHFLSLGGKKAIDPLENASVPEMGTESKSESAPKSMAEALAKSGRVVSGGD